KVVDSPGDNLLAEFASVVDAVQCAVAVQKEISARNAELPENRKMQFRIGINLGDVIQEGDRIYGDGVNIAARLEGLAEPGGICISKTAFVHIESKLPYGYDFIGDQTVKNISKPVGAYRVLMDPRVTVAGKLKEEKLTPVRRTPVIVGVAVVLVLAIAVGIWQFYMRRPSVKPASVEKMAYQLPDKPSIAVLPFSNLSGDPEQEYFSDGLTEEIIAALSSVPKLFVIARNSTFTYKGKPIKIQQVSEELGVQYVLEGSVRKGGDKVRITAQLIDALTGKHLWANRYDRNLSDIFAVQDEITKNIITAMQVELTEGEEVKAASKGTNNLEAYLKYLQANELINKINPESNALGKQLAEEAVALDPEYAWAYYALGRSHMMDVWVRASKSPKASIAKATELVQKAIVLDDSLAEPHGLLGFLYSMTRQYDKGIVQAEKAVVLNPNSAFAHFLMGKTLFFAGRCEESIPEYKKAIRLNPIPPNNHFWSLGLSYAYAGQYDEAITWCEKAVRQEPNDLLARMMMTVVYSLSDRDKDAQAEAAEVLRIQPKFTLDKFKKKLTYKREVDRERFLGALHKAGIPDKPPLQLPDKPSIAVLPFDNLSGDPKQEYLADGISENIISTLSKISKMFVIARNSTFTYKGKPVNVKQVSRELGVRYVLEGSVQKAGDQLRVTAQLVDATTGNHLWSERYDRELKDIFALQDDITKKIITALQVKLTEGEQARTASKGTNNLDAYLKFLQSMETMRRFNRESNALAKQLAEEAVALDPNYAPAYRALSATYLMDVWLGTSKSPKQSLAKAIELVQKAIALDDTYAEAYSALGFLYSMREQHDKAVLTAEHGVALNPNSADAHLFLGHSLRFAGRYEESIPEYKTAIRLNPIPPNNYLFGIAKSYAGTGQYEEAITWGKKAVLQNPNDFIAQIILTEIYSLSGRYEEARAQAAEVLRIQPKFTLEKWAKRIKGPNKEKAIDALRKAGLPE
ncbi:MAG: tetratricopeptide repeat protein, partial [Desulfobacterales bacterium]